MQRNGVYFLAGLGCLAVLVLVGSSLGQTPLVVAFEAVVLGLLTYAATFLIRPRRRSHDKAERGA